MNEAESPNRIAKRQTLAKIADQAEWLASELQRCKREFDEVKQQELGIGYRVAKGRATPDEARAIRGQLRKAEAERSRIARYCRKLATMVNRYLPELLTYAIENVDLRFRFDIESAIQELDRIESLARQTDCDDAEQPASEAIETDSFWERAIEIYNSHPEMTWSKVCEINGGENTDAVRTGARRYAKRHGIELRKGRPGAPIKKR